MQPRSFPAAYRRWLLSLVALAIIGGVFFRIYHLERKVYWDDEIYTSLRALGFSEAEWVERSHHVTDVAELRQLLHPAAVEPQRHLSATVGGLAAEEPQHAPLYYAAAHEWIRLFGNSTAAMRSLSAVIGLAALPVAFWFCFELFGTTSAAWIGVALFATSPVLVLYSQEAREYSLWALAIFFLGASFLRAARLGRAADWALYAAALIFGLYVSSQCAILAAGQAIYLVARERSRPRALLFPALAMLAGFACFSPWLLIMAKGADQIHRGMATLLSTKYSASHILRTFVADFRVDFLDFNQVKSARLNALLLVPVLALVGYAAYVLCRRSEPRVWGYIVVTAVATTLPVILPDLLFSGSRTANVRYLFPLIVDVDLAVVYLLYLKLVQVRMPAATTWGTARWQALFVAILACRFASLAVSSQADTWWNKFDEKSIAVAKIVNSTGRAVLVSDDYLVFALTLSNYLDPSIRVALKPRCYLCNVAAGEGPAPELVERAKEAGPIFLLGPSQGLEARFEDLALGSASNDRLRCIDVRSNCKSDLSLW
jgi:uncharacterized membrane protein